MSFQPSGARVTGYLADRSFGNTQRSANLALAELAAVQQLQCVSYLAHGDPWCGHSWAPVKNRAAYASLDHSDNRWGVRFQNGTLSAITVERCPR